MENSDIDWLFQYDWYYWHQNIPREMIYVASWSCLLFVVFVESCPSTYNRLVCWLNFFLLAIVEYFWLATWKLEYECIGFLKSSRFLLFWRISIPLSETYCFNLYISDVSNFLSLVFMKSICCRSDYYQISPWELLF